MRRRYRQLIPLADRGPLRVMFLVTSMPVGGAETLLVNLVRRLDRSRFLPELCCLKTLGPLGEELAAEVPATHGLLRNKFDVRVWRRLSKLLRSRRIDALVTVGAGDKMFWGRLAAWSAGTPVVISALHSTGWPDSVGRLNRLLTRVTGAIVAVAQTHGRHLTEVEKFPRDKVRVIPNGVDVARFAASTDRHAVRRALGIERTSGVVGIVAALRPEKNHTLFLQVAAAVRRHVPLARFLIVGDGPERALLERTARELGLGDAVLFVGSRSDIPDLLSAIDVFMLTSRMEASPVSILEAMAAGKPVVAPRVGSIADVVEEGVTGFMTEPSDAAALARHAVTLLKEGKLADAMGRAGRLAVAERGSLDTMVRGYEDLIAQLYTARCVKKPDTSMLDNSEVAEAPSA